MKSDTIQTSMRVYFKRVIGFLLFVCLFGLTSCTKNSSKNAVKIILPDTALTHKKVDIGYLEIQQVRKYLNLKNLHYGVDSFELRIYESGSFTPERMFLIKYEDSSWICSVYDYWSNCPLYKNDSQHSFNIEEIAKSTIVDSVVFRNIIPKQGWDSFIDSLAHFELDNMISQSEIPNFNDIVCDGTSYHFEVASKNQYKYFCYHSPNTYKDQNNIKATRLLKYIGRLLDLRLVYGY